jgi:hypothetical protein
MTGLGLIRVSEVLATQGFDGLTDDQVFLNCISCGEETPASNALLSLKDGATEYECRDHHTLLVRVVRDPDGASGSLQVREGGIRIHYDKG